MFDAFLRMACGLVVLAIIAVFVVASVEIIIPLLVIAAVIYVLYHVARGFS